MTTATAGMTQLFECRNSVDQLSAPTGSKNLLRLDMHPQRSVPKRRYQKLAIAVRILQNT